MEHPTTGRRRQRSGAVSVAELVQRTQPVDVVRDAEPPQAQRRQAQPPPTQPPQDEPAHTPPAQPAGSAAPTRHAAPPPSTIVAADAPPDAPVEPERGSGTIARVCRTAGLTLGVLAMTAGVTVAWTINQQEPQRPVAQPSPGYEISGVDALRPDALARHLGERGPVSADPRDADPTLAASDGQDGQDGSAPNASEQRTRALEAPGNVPPSTPSARTEPEAATPTGLVRKFYRLLADDPQQAAGLLDPDLLGSGRVSFVRAWSELRELRVERLADTGDGTVTAVVRMLQPDGSALRVRQEFSTTSEGLPLIGDVRLLSAQRG